MEATPSMRLRSWVVRESANSNALGDSVTPHVVWHPPAPTIVRWPCSTLAQLGKTHR